MNKMLAKLLLFILCFVFVSRSQDIYTITTLGKKGQFCNSLPRITDTQTVIATFMMRFELVGNILQPVDAGYEWVSGTWQPLSNLPGGQWNMALDANNNIIVGVAGLNIGGKRYAAILGRNGAPTQSLGTLGGDNSVATAVNQRGVIVGGAQSSLNIWRAFRWTPEYRTMQDLGTLEGQWAYAYAVNNDGIAVGASETWDGSVHAFSIYNNMIDLNMFLDPEDTHILMKAEAINASGRIVGRAITSDGTHYRGFEVCGGLAQARILEPLPGFPDSSALGISDNGVVVGYSVIWPSEPFGVYSKVPTLWINGQPTAMIYQGESTELSVASDANHLGRIILVRDMAGDVLLAKPVTQPAQN